MTEAEIAVFEAWFGGLFDEGRGRLADCMGLFSIFLLEATARRRGCETPA